VNVRFTSFLEMADRHVIYKQIAKEVAAQRGWR
jgi:glutamine synthetase